MFNVFQLTFEDFIHSTAYKAKAAQNWNAKTGNNKYQYRIFEEDSTDANQERTTKNRAFTFSTQSWVCYAMHFFLFCETFFCLC